jgi:N-acyl-D-aspartate/D-glutamate deacylase
VGKPTSRSGPSSPDRRKLLLALGFGAANAVVLSQLGRGRGLVSAISGEERPVPQVLGAGAPGPSVPPALADAAAQPEPGHVFGTVIKGGRVIDPETRFDAIADVGIDGATITAVSLESLQGQTTIDAANRVVSPGFIDLLSYEPNPYGIWFKIGDGVTTNLGMHGINAQAADFFAQYGAEGSPCHYGGAYDNPFMRGQGGLGLDAGEAASRSQIDELEADCRQQLADGWIGLDFEPEYAPGTTYDEIVALAGVAAEAGVPCFFHGRYSDNTPPGTNAETLDEILRVARDTGVGVHVQHITSTGGTFSMPESLATLDAAVAEGIGVTACMYPYTFWATYLGSARFADGWQERFHIDYGDLAIAGTGERLTEETFREYQQDNLLAAAYAIPEDEVRLALRSPVVMIGSDAILEPSNNNHPRSTGCFTRVLGHYVRDEGVISLVDALAKMTIMPATRLQARAPALKKKGRLQRGADADITIFDPTTVADRSTIENPAQLAVGIDYVFVLGQAVQTPEGQRTDVRPGQPIKSVLS